MNYLAHIFLSGEDPDLLAGNFMGDFIKGSDYRNYPQGIANGMVFHRFIDSFTDQHAESALLREKLRPTCGRYAGIALDMIYDYYLAESWSDYSELKLEDLRMNLICIWRTTLKSCPLTVSFSIPQCGKPIGWWHINLLRVCLKR